MATPIAYLIHTFPQFSSTFINDEIDEMRKQGVEISLFAIQRPGENEFPPAFRRFRDETTYVFPLKPLEFIWRQLQGFFKSPLGFLQVWFWILNHPKLSMADRKRTLIHFAEAIYLYPEIKKRGIRHIHVHFLLGNASIAFFLARLYNLTYSLTAHGSDIFVEKVLQSEKLSGAVYTRVATEFNAKYLQPLLNSSQRNSMEVIPFGVEKPEGKGSPNSQSTGEWIRLSTVGRLIWQKAHHLLLDACAKLISEGFEFRLRIVGDGPLRGELEKQILEKRLAKHVTLVGALPRDAVWKEYENADLFVLSSVSEGSPIVILEALASGIPVIAPALHGIPEMFTNGEEGLLFKTGSAESLTDSLRSVLVDETLRKQLRSAAAIKSRQLNHPHSVERFRLSLETRMAGLPITTNQELVESR